MCESIEARRLLAGGIRDTSFGTGGIVTAAELSDTTLTRVGIQPDGKILVGGTSYVTRLTRDGALDPSFGNNGFRSSYDMLLAAAPDGRFYLVKRSANRVERYTANGQPDLTFGSSGAINTSLGFFNPSFTRVLADGSLVVGGATGGLRKVTNGGTLSNLGANISGTVYDMVELADGDLLVAHTPSSSTGRSKLAVTRINPDGTLDSSFTRFVIDDANAQAANGIQMVRQSNGRILVAFNWSFDTAIFAIDQSGHSDLAWGNSGMLRFDYGASNERTEEMLVHEDDSLTLANSVILNANTGGNTYSNIADVMIVHLNAEGERDGLFGVNGATRYNGGTSDTAEAFAQQPDGKLVLVSTPFLGTGGELTRYAAPVSSSPVSVSADGQLQVVGSPGADTISISEAGTKYVVNINGAEAQVSRVVVFSALIVGGAGDDQITFGVQSDLPVTVNGGSGADAVHVSHAQAAGTNLLNPQAGERTLTFADGTSPVNAIGVERLDTGGASPFLTSAALEMETRFALTLAFDADIGTSLTASDLILRDVVSGATWAIRDQDLVTTLATDGTSVVSISLPYTLPSAHWRLDLPAGSIGSLAGAASTFEHQVRFDYSPGDVNGNGLTDFADVYTVVQRFGQSASGRSQGDVNYDGRVGFEDLLAVAQHFNLPLPLAAIAVVSKSKRVSISERLL